VNPDLYAPNQQVVRADGSGPAEEGTGGGGADEPDQPAAEPEPEDLDAMTKDQLLAYAAEHGVDANAAMTKDEIKAAIQAA
jgi:hypothetical protein